MESRRSQQQQSSNYAKIIAMVLFLCIDLGLNSILDYDLFNNQTTMNNASHLLLGLLGLQIVIQITIFLILFIAMADTFLFRVGLLGTLLKKFRLVLFMQVVYLFITLLTGSFRVRHFTSGNSLADIWTNTSFVQLSTAQKILAVPYYLLNLRAVIKLGDPFFYNKSAWVALVRQYKDHNDIAPIPTGK